VVIPPEEQTPLVVQLVHVILEQQREIKKLRDEVNRQKGLPETPKRPTAKDRRARNS